MTLITEDLGEAPDVSVLTLDEVLAADAFGAFAILVASEGEFIQAGNDWQPDEACRSFLAAHDSDPWVLEYRACGRQYCAAERVTLEQVRHAFRSYLAGRTEWRSTFSWDELEL